MSKVKFTAMKDGSKEDYLLLDKHEQAYIQGTADRIIKFMIPMLVAGIKEKNHSKALASFTQLV